MLFCATKSVQSFERYGHLKMEKEEKKSTYETFNFFPHSFVSNTFFFQAEDGIRDRSPSRGLGDVYKRQPKY